jgi:hypothetical protein
VKAIKNFFMFPNCVFFPFFLNFYGQTKCNIQIRSLFEFRNWNDTEMQINVSDFNCFVPWIFHQLCTLHSFVLSFFLLLPLQGFEIEFMQIYFKIAECRVSPLFGLRERKRGGLAETKKVCNCILFSIRTPWKWKIK